MRLISLKLSGFRNYESADLRFSPGLNLILGENAQGKTNLLEAVSCLSGVKSHRASSDRELIAFGQEAARLSAMVEARGREISLDLTLRRGGRRRVLVDEAPRKTSAELSETLRTVLFCPEDLSLVRAGAAERRRFLDMAISQLRPRYAAALSHYRRALEQKSRILRDGERKPALLDLLDEFDELLARHGAMLLHYRAHFLRRLSPLAAEVVLDFSGGRDTLRLQYETLSSVQNPEDSPKDLYPILLAHLHARREAERVSRQCLVGPHRDELLCLLDEKPARQFASQGQTRTLALALKLSERALHHEDCGEWPVLLLDDVLSELDAKRQAFVLERIRDGQRFLTGCEAGENLGDGARFHISGGHARED